MMTIKKRLLATLFSVLLATTGCIYVNADAVLILKSVTGLNLFGNVLIGTTKQLQFSITNTGEQDARNIALSGIIAPFSIVSTDCASELLVNESCNLTLEFSPTQLGLASMEVTIKFESGSDEITAVQKIEGNGVGDANIVISDPGYSFGRVAVGESAMHDFTVTNEGGTLADEIKIRISCLPLVPLDVRASRPIDCINSSFLLHDTDCDEDLEAGESCTVTVKYVPFGAYFTRVNHLVRPGIALSRDEHAAIEVSYMDVNDTPKQATNPISGQPIEIEVAQ